MSFNNNNNNKNNNKAIIIIIIMFGYIIMRFIPFFLHFLFSFCVGIYFYILCCSFLSKVGANQDIKVVFMLFGDGDDNSCCTIRNDYHNEKVSVVKFVEMCSEMAHFPKVKWIHFSANFMGRVLVSL